MSSLPQCPHSHASTCVPILTPAYTGLLNTGLEFSVRLLEKISNPVLPVGGAAALHTLLSLNNQGLLGASVLRLSLAPTPPTLFQDP